MVVPNNHGVFLLKMIMTWGVILGGFTTCQGMSSNSSIFDSAPCIQRLVSEDSINGEVFLRLEDASLPILLLPKTKNIGHGSYPPGD